MAPPRPLAVLCTGLIVYGVLLAMFVGAVPGGSDTSGYFNEARLLSHFKVHAPMRVLAGVPASDAPPYLYVPLGFRPSPDGSSRIVPTYPPGLPILLAATSRATGWRHAGDVLLVLHALAGIALTFALGRMCGVPPAWSLLGAGVLMASPLYLHMSLWALSDVPATVWAVAAVVTAFKSGDQRAWALASGVCVAVGFLLRPSNFLIILPVVLAAWPSLGSLFVIALGSAAGAAGWMAVNQLAYGSFLQSGYGAISSEFHLELIPGTLAFEAGWLPLLLSPIVVLAPAILALAEKRPQVTSVLVAWVLAYIAFYAPYSWTRQDWWFLRFLLPAAPPLIVAGLIVLRSCLRWFWQRYPEAVVRAATAALVLAAVGVEAGQIFRLHAWTIGHGELKYGRVSDWLNANAPADSVVVAHELTGALYYYTNLTIVRADQLDLVTATRVHAAAHKAGVPLYAALFPHEINVLGVLPGDWSVAGAVDDVKIWRCDADTP